MNGLTLDSGAFIAAQKNDRAFLRFIDRHRQAKAKITVSALVLAQAWRGNVPLVARLINACAIEEFTLAMWKPIGQLLGRTGTADVVDAVVAFSAHLRGDTIVTSDIDDMERLLAELGSKSLLFPV
jgi:hypothetical protein